MAIYVTRWFDRWADQQGVNPQSLCAAVQEMQAGLYDANLGGGLYKKRLARSGQGKRSGFRTLVASNRESRWCFVFGFAKSARTNIAQDELQALKRLAKYLLVLPEEGLELAQLAGEVKEVRCHAQDAIGDS